MDYVIEGLLLPGAEGWRKGSLAVKNGRFCAAERTLRRVEAAGIYALPGFIDTHIHGAGGVSFDLPQGGLNAARNYLARRGVTAIAATVAAGGSELPEALDELADCVNARGGARVLGIHIEGPFLNPKRHGAFDPASLVAPNAEYLRECCRAARDNVHIMTVAPELEGAAELERAAESLGVTLSMGHSDATYAEASAAAASGFRRVTHLFNAMRPFHQREPGIEGAALTDDRVMCELICDFVHVHPAAIITALRCKTAARLCMISDAMCCAGMPDGEYDFIGRHFSLRDGAARLPDGTICGSAMTLADGVRNLLKLGVSPADVAEMSARNPARALGFDGGTLDSGAPADFVLLDEEYNVAAVYIAGEPVVMR